MLSCSFSSSRCSSAAVSGLGCLNGPCDDCEGSIIAAVDGRGELGRLPVFGTGGGPMTAEVLLDVLVSSDVWFVSEVEGVLDVRDSRLLFIMIGTLVHRRRLTRLRLSSGFYCCTMSRSTAEHMVDDLPKC